MQQFKDPLKGGGGWFCGLGGNNTIIDIPFCCFFVIVGLLNTWVLLVYLMIGAGLSVIVAILWNILYIVSI